ncbi:hypothetical protein ACFQUU_27285 [Herbaspirillum sp. GCM10030257]|uniref:hypothetical protein n=1 Tax=Herbaspirillum sp. GCM10030257 TaxID=3273393 RepID=UPI003613D624
MVSPKINSIPPSGSTAPEPTDAESPLNQGVVRVVQKAKRAKKEMKLDLGKLEPSISLAGASVIQSPF